MATEYIDHVERTHRLYGLQISEAAELLRIENPMVEYSPGFTKRLELKVQEITKNPKARLIRTEIEEHGNGTNECKGKIDAQHYERN